MPELPEVETTRRSLEKRVVGRRIAKVELHRTAIRTPIPQDFTTRVTGREIKEIRRRAKYLLFDLDSGEVMLAHLGMSGSFLVAEKDYALRRHDHVVLHLDDGKRLLFHDPRRFGIVTLIEKGKEASHPLLSHLGPEPLGRKFSPRYLEEKLSARKGPIKPVLMDQCLVVGVGNIYASESLFLAELHPQLPARDVAKHAEALIAAIRASLKSAIASGGSTLRDYTDASGAGGYFQHRFNVYDRAGKPCRSCGTTIETFLQSGRSTYYCPRCQRAKKPSRK